MTRSALSNIAYEALVRARRKFSNREERCIRETWTAEQELVLLRLYLDMPNEVLAARLNKTLQQICSKAYRLGLKKSPEFSKKIRQDWGSATRFKKGNTPWNCGMKGLPARGRSSETQFKKGQKPHTWLPVGSTRVSADGYLQRKISDTGYPPRDWKSIHILLIEDLRNHLFATIEGLLDEEKPLDIERAKAVAHVSSVIIESAKVEVKALEIIGAPGGSTFMQIGREDSK